MDRDESTGGFGSGGLACGGARRPGLTVGTVGPAAGQQQHASLDTVRALHETVVSLREALERARTELAELRARTAPEERTRRASTKSTAKSNKKPRKMSSSINVQIKVSASGGTARSTADERESTDKEETAVVPETADTKVAQEEEETAEAPGAGDNLHLDVDALSLQSMSDGDNSVFSDGTTTPCERLADREPTSGNESDGVDDIELIFTTDETEQDLDKRDDLVSIPDEAGAADWRSAGDGGGDTPVLLHYRNLPSESSENFANENAENSTRDDRRSAQGRQVSTDSLLIDRSFDRDKSSSFERDESFDRFDEPAAGSGGAMAGGLSRRRWSQFGGRAGHPPVETDISKCGVLDDEYNVMARRNTCPNPAPYRPIMHREALGLSPFSARAPRLSSAAARHPSRPILTAGHQGPRRESGAQTDISALPGSGGVQWRSESHLAGADKMIGGQFTLPSKFALPDRYGKCSLRLSEKTQENRRVMLSDINFTSMVPELSRSADHLCQEDPEGDGGTDGGTCRDDSAEWLYGGAAPGPPARTAYDGKRNGQYRNGLSSSGFGRYDCTGWSGDLLGGRCRASSGDLLASRHYSKPRLRASLSLHSCTGAKQLPTSRYKVSFRDSTDASTSTSLAASLGNLRGSLPDLRCSHRGGSLYAPKSCCHCSHKSCRRHCCGDSRGSTESLVDEADDFLRRSADLMPPPVPPVLVRCPAAGRRRSDSDVPNEAAMSGAGSSSPFLPRSARDLKPGYRVKVIGGRGAGTEAGGRVLAGRVRYIGAVAGAQHVGEYVGVQLDASSGDSDGTFMGRRFFNCEPQHALFVPFSKIVMAWIP